MNRRRILGWSNQYGFWASLLLVVVGYLGRLWPVFVFGWAVIRVQFLLNVLWRGELNRWDDDRMAAAPRAHLSPDEGVNAVAVANGSYLALSNCRLLIIGMSKVNGDSGRLVFERPLADLSVEKWRRWPLSATLWVRVAGDGIISLTFENRSRLKAVQVRDALAQTGPIA